VIFVSLRRLLYQTLLALLLSGAAVACAYAALKIDFRQVVHGLMQAVGIRHGAHGGNHPPEILVSAGNELTISGPLQTLKPIGPEEVARRLAWAGMYEQDGWLNFRGQSLEMVAAEFNRHNRRQLRIGDPRTGRLLVGGKFRVNDVEGFVAALGMTHGVRATLASSGLAGSGDPLGDVITLSGGNSPGSAEIPGAPEPGRH
jgi:hypothetical protein